LRVLNIIKLTIKNIDRFMKNIYFKIIFVISVILIFTSCQSIDMLLHPNNYTQKKNPVIKEYIYDTVKISNFNGELTEPASPGIKPSKQLVFTETGQSYIFKPGETIEIISAGIDFGTSTFDIETNEDTKEIKLTLIDKNNAVVSLTSKCQTIVRTGIDFIPRIELAKDLNPEQVVITPIFDNNCIVIGYQIRYGSTERGCIKEAKEMLTRFQDCVKNPTKSTGSPKISSDCQLKRKLGIPCY